tara:strand:- start:269 stop:1384 length:1116 start_codon:yes stop_codon:yes gene_type:complete
MSLITNKWIGTEYFKVFDFHHIECFVGNAKQSLYYYCLVMGFKPFAYKGPETGNKDFSSYVLKKNKIYIVLTSPVKSTHKSNEWINKHGDGIYDIAFLVDDAKDAYDSCISRGAKSAYEPTFNNGKTYCSSGIKTYGDVIHSFISKNDFKETWAPGFVELNQPELNIKDTGLIRIDHVVGNVEEDRMDYWKDYYENIFGFTNFIVFDDSDISTKYSSLKSRVMRSENWKVRLPINEPANGLKKSQIQEYLDFNNGPGVQHVALLTDNIEHTIGTLRINGMQFLNVPNTYYDKLRNRVGDIDEDINMIKDLNILVDRDEEGYLLQLFSQPVQDRPTLFYEFIQRKGSRGFGQGNFQALFEAIEREQERRGNL